MMDRWQITIAESFDEAWLNVDIENYEGEYIATVCAPITEGATFDIRAAAIREAVELALQNEKVEL